ncbi:MetQ/NlpA family ABC transporter substrate-binding protein [Bifidobacterium castoris]|uniref:ABC transporter substrate-binding protein n=1 Tax=Bifidobacterium castoris TaxID=2306972 RepID=A0A430F9N7_9BIFI|nr:MetQ/NlpA family ABC transporter substrate-binding protein [Bifidobacterium castoris]RSX49546.1 ABC transporter substrate-binding protein [Bifidobacterium castoris]
MSQNNTNEPGGNVPELNTDEPVRVNHTARNIIIAVIVVALVAAAAFFGFHRANGGGKAAASAETKGTKDNPVKIGVVGATDPQWVEFKKQAEAKGVYVDIVDFQDYTSENPALDAGDLDMNEFQHLLYLANYNVQNGKDLQPLGGVAIYPLGVYSAFGTDGEPRYTDIKDLPAGSTVAIPNDETNQARAIGVLKAAGVVTLKGDWTAFTIPQDIDEAKSKVKVVPMKAEQIANTLKAGGDDLSAGVINNDYVADAGLDPTDAIYQDDAESEESRPYINIFAVRAADVDNAVYRKCVEIYQTKPVLDALQEESAGTAVFADKFTQAELAKYLDDIESDIRSNDK